MQNDFTRRNQIKIKKMLPNFTIKELNDILSDEEIYLWHLEQEYKE